MPKFDSKAIYRDLDQGDIWPVYWLYGTEKMKVREILKKIRTTILQTPENSIWSEEQYDGSEVDIDLILDSAQSLNLLGPRVKLMIIREAHFLKNLESLQKLLGPPQKLGKLSCVCVFISKDLDMRKKFSKVLQEKAAVIHCEEVPEAQKENFIQYLSKKRGMSLTPVQLFNLSQLEPWSLDIIDQELEKFQLAESNQEVFLIQQNELGKKETFMDQFFSRNRSAALPHVSYFSTDPSECLPLLGLMSWNVKQLSLLIADRSTGLNQVKLNPYLMERFRRWLPRWSESEIQALQQELMDIDFKMKQTPLLPLGLWNTLVMRFCT